MDATNELVVTELVKLSDEFVNCLHASFFYREFGPAQDYVPTRQLSLKSFGGRPGFTGGSGGQQRTQKPKAKQDLFTKILTIKVSPLVYHFD